MPLIIGMDEAGYGPNLGPLVVTATVWEVPGNPRTTDLWKEFDGIIAQTPAEEYAHIQVADSKQVYSPAKGLDNLEPQGVTPRAKLSETQKIASALTACSAARYGRVSRRATKTDWRMKSTRIVRLRPITILPIRPTIASRRRMNTSQPNV